MEKNRMQLKEFILSEFLPGEKPDNLKDDTSLFQSGVLDSMGTLKMVEFLERTFKIKISASEIGTKNFDSLIKISDFICLKQLQSNETRK